MDKIRIRGSRPLAGKITIGGAKNAALRDNLKKRRQQLRRREEGGERGEA